MEFDIYGNLQPSEIILTDWTTFETTFVSSFPKSATRAPLFSDFSTYMLNVKSVIHGDFHQWIDGSFITNKLNPKDIDFVIFINFKDYINNQIEIDRLREMRNVHGSGMDGYFVPVYPDNHPKRFLFEADQLQWQHLFGRSRTDKKKGFIELRY